MSPTYFIGVDIGTTSTKAIACSETGALVGSSNYAYPIHVPQAGWAEQDPETILKAVVAAVRQAIVAVPPDQIAAVGFSAAMHSLIALDTLGNCLTPSLIWADNRSVAQAEALKQSEVGRQLYQRTGVPMHPMLPLTKLMWLRQHDPERFQRAARFVSIKEYIFFRLFGCFVVDYSIAAASGLFNWQTWNWDAGAIALAGISVPQLSELVPPTLMLRGLQSEFAQAMGLLPETPFMVGASDGVLANLGVGAIAPGQIAVTIGTSGAVRATVTQPLLDPQGRTFCYPLTPQQWVIGGPTNSGGLALRWFRDEFGAAEVAQAKHQGGDAYDLLTQAAAKIPAGAEGLLFLPYLTGERSPHWNAEARGVFFGLGLNHQRAHLLRAVLEGVVLNLYSIYTIVQDLAGPTQEIRAAGGFARSPLWCQMLADGFGQVVQIPEVYESSSVGAVMLTRVALGADLAEVSRLIRVTTPYVPEPKTTAIYQQLFSLYQQLYTDLSQTQGKLATWRYSQQGHQPPGDSGNRPL